MARETISPSAVKRSTWAGIIVFGIFALLLVRILIIQTVKFDEYQSKVINQITTESPVAADRGKIFDRNGNVLATNITTYRIFINPSSIKSNSGDAGSAEYKDYAAIVSRGLSEILGVSYDNVYKQAVGYTNYLDRTIMRKAEESLADKVREFIDKESLEDMIYLEAQSTRYYPGDTLGCHMIGFTSSDGVGLYGLEYQYNDYLKGTNGYYIKARDSHGNEMPSEYDVYIDAIDGYDLTTTIDASVQRYLEEQLAKTVADHEVQNRACGIVMDVNTGAILAMATSSPFDLNDPWALNSEAQSIIERCGYDENSDEYDELVASLLTTNWSNKAVAESYIPGSTFKIITSAMSFEEKKVKVIDTLHCDGHKEVLGINIKCHKIQGHGTLSFAQGLQQSCNEWFMTLGLKVGISKFTQYIDTFGYHEKTGIDLPGEGNGIFNAEMSELDLAIYAFGQNFNVTPIQHISAISAVANGGELLTPYIVEKVTDKAGNVVFSRESELKRKTVSEETCKTISQILEEGVSGDGGAKNAYVAGYKVAAKTGTSEKKERECPRCGYTGVPTKFGEQTLFVCSVCKYTANADEFEVSEGYICSTVAYAPANDPQVAVIIIVDEPTKGVLYGSTVAAPYVSDALENILPQLGVIPQYSEAELAKLSIKVGSYKNWSVESAIEHIKEKGLDYEIVGNGDTVVAQKPAAGATIEKPTIGGVKGKVYLYTDSSLLKEQENLVAVPNLVGDTPTVANAKLIGRGLNIRIEGSKNGTTAQVIEQSVAPGTMVPKGEVITLTFRHLESDEEPNYRD